jgi:hypothetical protein
MDISLLLSLPINADRLFPCSVFSQVCTGIGIKPKAHNLLETTTMIKKQLRSKTIHSALFAAVMLFATSSAFAQVKIGTNPTTIDPANNLEVEASTAGRKTSVNKTTGQVTIADGTQGAGKILTSDANGGASWQPNVRSSTTVKAIAGSGNTTLNDLTTTIMNGSSTSITLPSDKSVFINFMAGYDDATLITGSFPNYGFTLYVDGAPTDISIVIQEPGGSSENISFTLSGVLDLTAGTHTFDVRGRRTFNSTLASGTNFVFRSLSQRMFITYLN